jgi:hypothetical protein
MQNGFFITETGEFIPLDSRANVASERTQRKLEAVWGPRKILCGCGIPHGRELWLERYRTLDGSYRLDRRREEDEHGEDCPFNLGTLASDGWPSPKAIFENASPESACRSLRHFVRRIASNAYTRAILSKPHSLITAFRSQFHSEMNHPMYAPWVLVQETRDCDVQLSFGLCDHVVPGRSALVEDWSRGTGLALRALTFSPGVAVRATRACSIFGTVVPGPYFYLALVRQGIAEVIVLFPVYRSARRLDFIESIQERRRATQLERLGKRFAKPIRIDDGNVLLENWARQHGVPFVRYEFRPDFICPEGYLLFAEELRGFKVGQNRAYDELMSRKRAVLEKHPCNNWLKPRETFPEDLPSVVETEESVPFDGAMGSVTVTASAWAKVLSDMENQEAESW